MGQEDRIHQEEEEGGKEEREGREEAVYERK